MSNQKETTVQAYLRENGLSKLPDATDQVKNLNPFRDWNPKDKQIGGDHYATLAIQPGDYVVKNGIGWYEGNAIKYLTRHKAKGQKQDLEKAIHYIELAIQHYYGDS